MSQLTIESNDKLLINALTMWFEDGDALEAFSESGANKAYVGACEMKDREPLDVCEIYCGANYDESSYSTFNTIDLDA